MTALRAGRFPQTIVRRRQGPARRDTYGEWVPGDVTETAMRASVQPLKLDDDELEGGQQLRERVKVYVPEPSALAAALDDRGADHVLWNETEYIVIESRSWAGGHTRATLLRET